MRSMKYALLLALAATAAGCTFDDSGMPLPADPAGGGAGDADPGDDDPTALDPDAAPPEPSEPEAPPPELVSCRVDGENLGVVGLNVAVGDTTIVFESWQPKPDKPDEYIGFTLSANAADLEYRVVAGSDSFTARGSEWVHPDLAGGDASKISRIEFCGNSGPSDN